MGRVFSGHEIAAGMVPDRAAFEAAQTTYISAVLDGIADETLSGSVIYGSAAIDRTNERSDHDSILILTDSSDRSHRAGRAVTLAANEAAGGKIRIGGIALAGSVPLGSASYSREELATGRHEIDRFFGQHLTGDKRLVYGEDPAGYIRFANDPALVVFNAYIRNKKHRLGTAWHAFDGPDYYVGLQRMLEAPLAIGRKLLRVLDELEGSQTATANSADKPLVSKLSLAVFEQMGVAREAQKILEMDRQYSETLKQTVAGNVSCQDYTAVITELHSHLPSTRRWLDDIDRILPAHLKRAV